MLWNAVLLSIREMRRNIMRSFLTMLGVLIGVSAVITMVTLGNGASLAVAAQIAKLGNNLLILSPGQRQGAGRDGASAPQFQLTDALAIQAQIAGLKAVVPTAGQSTTVIAGAKNWTTTITGSTNEYFEAGNWDLPSGRTFTDTEERAGKAVCVIGETVRTKLFGNENPVGSNIRVKNFFCEIIGLLGSKGQASMGRDQDDTVIMPLKTLQRRLSGSRGVASIMVSVSDGVSTANVKDEIDILMRERRHITGDKEEDFNVLDTKEIADTMSGATRILTALLGSVAAMSLLVGGIGIMNIMLVSIAERTREIGTRLAIGALAREVLLQFLIEAIMLSSVGGVTGLLLATIFSLILTRIMQIPYVFNLQINVIAFAFSAAIGVIFGYLPARRAAQLDPIEALRHE